MSKLPRMCVYCKHDLPNGKQEPCKDCLSEQGLPYWEEDDKCLIENKEQQ